MPTALELAVAVLFTLEEVSVSTQGLRAGSAHCSGACSCGPLHTWGGLSVHSGVGSRQCPLLWSLQLRSSSHLGRSQCPLRGWEQAVPTALELAVVVELIWSHPGGGYGGLAAALQAKL